MRCRIIIASVTMSSIIWLLLFCSTLKTSRCFVATICHCINGSVALYAKKDIQSDVIGYLVKDQCCHGYYTEDYDWLTVKIQEMEMYLRRNDLTTCNVDRILNQEIRLQQTLDNANTTHIGQVLHTIYRKRFLLDNMSRVQCNFDQNSLCLWINVPGHDDFDWILYQSSTPTDETGPEFDHTLRNSSGGYIFIESSLPRVMFDSAWIQSPTIAAIGQPVHCFRFWYHMFGTSTGRLDVYQATDKNLPGNLMWSVKGDYGNTWLEGRVALRSIKDYSIVIAGFVGNGHHGDIAVDDVSITDGFCDVMPPSASRFEVSQTSNASVDGVWQAWSLWSSCDVTCGGGTEIRTRQCYFPPGVRQGHNCIGQSAGARICHLERCPEPTTCDLGWFQHGGSCYFFELHNLVSWNESKALCESHNSHLAVVTSYDESQFLRTQLYQQGARPETWIDGTDVVEDNHWMWSSTGEPIRFTDWHPGEPNSNGGNEDCLAYTGGAYTWNDNWCGLKGGYICEKE